MRALIILFAIIAVTLANDRNEQYRSECKTELNIQQETIEKFKKGEYDEFVPCFTECVFRKMGMFSDGNFNIDVLTRMLKSDTKTPDELKADIESCIDDSITDNCQKAFSGFTCFKEKHLYKQRRS